LRVTDWCGSVIIYKYIYSIANLTVTIPKHPELGEFKGFAMTLRRVYTGGEINDRLSFSLEGLPDLEGPLEEALESIDRLRQAMPPQPQKEDSDPPQGMRIGIIAGSGGFELLALLALCGALDDPSPYPSRDDDEEDAFRHVAQMAEDSNPPPSGDAPPSWEEVEGRK
jgi:hypothetical protein